MTSMIYLYLVPIDGHLGCFHFLTLNQKWCKITVYTSLCGKLQTFWVVEYTCYEIRPCCSPKWLCQFTLPPHFNASYWTLGIVRLVDLPMTCVKRYLVTSHVLALVCLLRRAGHVHLFPALGSRMPPRRLKIGCDRGIHTREAGRHYKSGLSPQTPGVSTQQCTAHASA